MKAKTGTDPLNPLLFCTQISIKEVRERDKKKLNGLDNSHKMYDEAGGVLIFNLFGDLGLGGLQIFVGLRNRLKELYRDKGFLQT